MLLCHGIVKITKADPLFTFGDGGMVLNLVLATYERVPFSEKTPDRYDYYPAVMYFRNEEDAKMWAEQLQVGKIVDVKWATIEGEREMRDKNTLGRSRVRLYPDLRHTVPKD